MNKIDPISNIKSKIIISGRSDKNKFKNKYSYSELAAIFSKTKKWC